MTGEERECALRGLFLHLISGFLRTGVDSARCIVDGISRGDAGVFSELYDLGHRGRGYFRALEAFRSAFAQVWRKLEAGHAERLNDIEHRRELRLVLLLSAYPEPPVDAPRLAAIGDRLEASFPYQIGHRAYWPRPLVRTGTEESCLDLTMFFTKRTGERPVVY